MQIIIKQDYPAVSEEAAKIVLAEIARKPDLALGLVVGKTPMGLFERLRKSPDVFARVRFFNVDEFLGQKPSGKYSFNRFLHENLLDHVAHDPKNVRFLRGDVRDFQAEAEDFEKAIRAAGGIDLQILGLGRNGHLGFNEPGSSLGSRTRLKVLEPETLASYIKSVDSSAPATNFTITMGIGTILEARQIVLMASGGGKADIVRQVVEGPVTAEVPASVLQMHPRVSVILDEAAAADLKRKDYLKWIYENAGRVGQRKP